MDNPLNPEDRNKAPIEPLIKIEEEAMGERSSPKKLILKIKLIYSFI